MSSIARDAAPLQFRRRTTCPACACSSARQLLELPFHTGAIAAYLAGFYAGALDPQRCSEGTYCLLRCDACGLIYQRDVLDDDGLAWLYGGDDDAVVEAAARKHFGVRRAYSAQVEQLVVALGGQPARLHVLDYGAGWGFWLDMAAAYGCVTYTAELSAESAGRSAQRHQLVPATELPADRFDFINAEQVLEHVAEPLATMRSLAAAVKPGGIVRISVPNGSTVESLLERPDWEAPKGSAHSLNAVAPLEHVNCFDHASLLQLGQRAGLQPYRFPARQRLHSWERIRFVGAALASPVRRPKGTLLYFRRA